MVIPFPRIPDQNCVQEADAVPEERGLSVIPLLGGSVVPELLLQAHWSSEIAQRDACGTQQRPNRRTRATTRTDSWMQRVWRAGMPLRAQRRKERAHPKHRPTHCAPTQVPSITQCSPLQQGHSANLRPPSHKPITYLCHRRSAPATHHNAHSEESAAEQRTRPGGARDGKEMAARWIVRFNPTVARRAHPAAHPGGYEGHSQSRRDG